MKKNILVLLIFILSVNKSYSQLDKIETDDFDVVSFGIGTKYVLGHSVRCAHSALNFHRDLFEYEREKFLFSFKILVIMVMEEQHQFQ